MRRPVAVARQHVVFSLFDVEIVMMILVTKKQFWQPAPS